MEVDIVSDLVGSLQKGAFMLLLVVPAYILLLAGLYFYRGRKREQAVRRMTGDEAEALTGDWFGKKKSAPAAAEPATAGIEDWPAGWRAGGGVMIPDAEGTFHRVDLMIKADRGICLVLFEDKRATITGVPEDDDWQEQTPKAPVPFANPLPRLAKAMAALEDQIRAFADETDMDLPEEIETRGFVVFPDEADPPMDAEGRILRESQLLRMLRLGETGEQHDVGAEFADALWSWLTRRAMVTEPDIALEAVGFDAAGRGGGLFGILDSPAGPGGLTPRQMTLLALVVVLVLLVMAALGLV